VTGGVPQPVAASLPVVHALLEQAARKGYRGGVLGVHARPEWSGPAEFDFGGTSVRVASCPSTLAVREALLDRSPDRWLVVLTDRTERDLGLGVTAHLTWRRLRRPDPWDAVRERFAATWVDTRLYTEESRELAVGLLAATPSGGWPPARGGTLTAAHAFGAVAAHHLGLGSVGAELTPATLLAWSARADTPATVARLRAQAGDQLVDRLTTWLGTRCGAVGQVVSQLLPAGRLADVVPLGLIARVVLATAPDSAPRALLRRELGARMPDATLATWAGEAEAAARELLRDEEHTVARLLARADELLDAVEAAGDATESDVLARGLTARLADLGESLRRCADRAEARAAVDGANAPLADVALLPDVEQAVAQVGRHLLARADESRGHRADAAVRLARWLALPVEHVTGELSAHVARHRDVDSWVDRAVAVAWPGVDDEQLARGIRAVLAAVRLRRDGHDLSFGSALERSDGSPAIPPIENLLTRAVLPLVRDQPVLLVVADGMSCAVGSEVVDDVIGRYQSWVEYLPPDRGRRLTTLAALPSLTRVSRASLLCGELAVGEQAVERTGFEAWCRAAGVAGRLFHKLTLDTTGGGFALAHDVAAAVDDTDGVPLVACVLNTIDDALDRSDPGGTEWTTDAVRHLRPLLDRARRAGRLVVLTSDHGHVVERRDGRVIAATGASSNRSRPYDPASPPAKGEIRARGRRVLDHGGDAVLAVDERIRYGPLKAGYHGGGSPAEVVVPVYVLAPGPGPRNWRPAPPQAPDWWRGPLSSEVPVATRADAPSGGVPTLFDPAPARTDLATAVVASDTFRDQRARGARLPITDDAVANLLRALLGAPGHRLDPDSAAAALGVATVQLAGALPMVQRLLNVEQYPVLGRDPDGATVVLNVDLLRDQFRVGP
jgi:hypothetical protein